MSDAFCKALEILKAEGKSPQEFLRYAEEEERKAREIQDAEDVHVRAWMTTLQDAGTSAYGGPVDEVWSEASEAKRDIWRGSYRANRDHFARVQDAEKEPDPDLIGLGSPEPDRSTIWRDDDGDVWAWVDRGPTGVSGWNWKDAGAQVKSWADVQEDWSGSFPWVKLTD